MQKSSGHKHAHVPEINMPQEMPECNNIASNTPKSTVSGCPQAPPKALIRKRSVHDSSALINLVEL